MTARSSSTTLPVYAAADAFREAGEALALARRLKQPSAMVSAVTLRAQLAGLLLERQEVVHRSRATAEELDRTLDESVRQASELIRRLREGGKEGRR